MLGACTCVSVRNSCFACVVVCVCELESFNIWGKIGDRLRLLLKLTRRLIFWFDTLFSYSLLQFYSRLVLE